MSKGIFVSFEGLDGSGKSTQISFLREYLESRGIDTAFFREPGGTEIGEKLRVIILDKDNAEMTDNTEALLYSASRTQLVNEKIKPALEAGITVICDRYVDSSIAYQAYGRGLGDFVRDINRAAIENCMPDLTFFIDLKPGEGRKRIQKTGAGFDRLESENNDFHTKVYEGYMAIAKSEPERFIVIDGMRGREEIFADIKLEFDKILESRGL